MAQAPDTHRVTATLPMDTYKNICYWAEKHGISINQYLIEAIDMKIAYENRDYPLSTLEQARLNQLIDGQAVLSSNIKSTLSPICLFISSTDPQLG